MVAQALGLRARRYRDILTGNVEFSIDGEDAMSRVVERSRKRQRELAKTKIDWRQWIGSPTAWLALVISVVSLFSQMVYYSDELSFVGWVHFRMQDGILNVVVPGSVTFINSGTRPVAVTSIRMASVRVDEHLVCDTAADTRVAGVYSPSVIKPHETATVQLTKSGHEEAFVAYADQTTEKKEPQKALICLTVEFVIVGAPMMRKRIPLLGYEYAAKYLGGFSQGGVGLRGIPTYLVKRDLFWTSVDGDKESLFEDTIDNVSGDRSETPPSGPD